MSFNEVLSIFLFFEGLPKKDLPSTLLPNFSVFTLWQPGHNN